MSIGCRRAMSWTDCGHTKRRSVVVPRKEWDDYLIHLHTGDDGHWNERMRSF